MDNKINVIITKDHIKEFLALRGYIWDGKSVDYIWHYSDVEEGLNLNGLTLMIEPHAMYGGKIPMKIKIDRNELIITHYHKKENNNGDISVDTTEENLKFDWLKFLIKKFKGNHRVVDSLKEYRDNEIKSIKITLDRINKLKKEIAFLEKEVAKSGLPSLDIKTITKR